MDESARHVRRLSQALAYHTLQMHEAVARRAGISGTDHKYLGFLMQKGRMTAGELAALTGLTTGAVTGLIDRMEKKKLVRRQFADDDRRKVFIEPNTENIMALLEPLYKEFRSNTEKLITSFSSKDLKVLETYFTRSIELMTEATSKLNKK